MTNGMHVLIVDDHPLFREGLKGLLTGLAPDVDIWQAASLQEAEALTHEFDLVLMDLSMPGTCGMEALQRIKARYESAAVVVISGDESPETIRQAIHAGAAGYVPKSTDPGVTTQALKLVLAHGIYLPREAMATGSGITIHAPPPGHDHAASRPVAPPAWSNNLSPRQLAVLRCLLQGKPNKVIAREIGIAEGTVKAHLWAVYQLLGVNNRAQAMYKAHELNLFSVLPTAK